MLWIRLGAKELFKNKGFALFFILNLSLGLAGFIAIHSFGIALNRHLDENLKDILTADIVLSANRPLNAVQLSLADQVLGPDKTVSQRIRFYTMARAQDNARLVEVLAIDAAYPLYGNFLLEGSSEKKDLQATPGVFMTRDTAYALGIQSPADPKAALTLGHKQFRIQDFFIVAPGRSLISVDLAPKVYMGIDQLEGTGLIQFGSRIRYSHYYRLSPGADSPALAQALRQKFSEVFPGQPRVHIQDSRDASQRLNRIIRYFTGYMGLVSVVALFLAGIATAYLFRGYLDMKQEEMAILMSVGARQREVYFYASFQLIVLGTLASCLSVFISLFLIQAFPVIFQGLLPARVQLATEPSTIALAVGMGMGGSLIFCLPVFVRLAGIKPLILLQGPRAIHGRTKTPVLIQVASVLPGLGAFFLVSVMAAGSMKTAGIFVAGFSLALVFFSGMGWLVFSGCRFFSFVRNPVVKITFRNLFRNKWSSLSCFVTIALGTFLIALIPQIQKGLQSEIMRPSGLKIPVFFLVDIQEEQKQALVEFIRREQAQLTNLSPMVRGRILSVNQQPFYGENKGPRSGSSASRTRGRRLEFNFSHRQTLDVSETIVQGTPLSRIPWTFGSESLFEISMEKSFAERYGLKIGDQMKFDIQGIQLEGQVKNLRRVRWNSFQPNFFLLFQAGVLNDAPKTFLAAISHVPQDLRQALKNHIVTAFPNVSVIDVTQMAGTLLGIMDRLSLSIRFMAWLAIAAGLVSIFSIARHQAWKNENQVNLLKVLGADFKTIQAIVLLEFGFIGFTAALFAILLSLGFSRAISWYFFDRLWQFDLMVCLGLLLLTTLVCMGTALVASWNVMNTKPARLLANM